MDVNLGELFSDMAKQIQIVIDPQFWVMPALHQDLYDPDTGQFFDLLVDLLLRQDVKIGIFLRAIESAKLAINIANVRVVNVALNDIGDDLVPSPPVGRRFGQFAPMIRQGAEFFGSPTTCKASQCSIGGSSNAA